MAARITSSSFGATQTETLGDAVSCQPPSSSTSQKETHIDFFLRLIENPSIQSNPSIRVILESQVEELMRQKSQELTTQQEETYAWAKKLLIDQKVSSFVAKKLLQMHAPTLPEQSSFRSESPAVMLKAFNPEGTAVMAAQSVTALPTIAFGAAEWKKYFGDVGVEPPLPDDIDAILSAPCPFWSGKKVQDTHLLVLIPQTVNGQPLTMKSLGELVKKPFQGNATQFSAFYLGAYTDPAAPKSHWALLTRDVVEGSRNKPYAEQEALIKAPYEVPTILDATVAIFMEHVRTGTRLYINRPLTCTQCQEKYDTDWQLIVGSFSASGLFVDSHIFGDRGNFGVGGLRKFTAISQSSSFQPSSSKSESSAVTPIVPKKEPPKVSPIMTAPPTSILPTIAFGAAEWKKYFGDVGVEPPLPFDINAIFSAPCPFWPGKKVQETHLLVLVPQTVNGQPLTMTLLGELVEKPLQGTATRYKSLNLGEYTDPAAPKSHWALLTRDVVEGSRNKSYTAHQALIKPPYEVPTILDATVAIFMWRIRTGTRPYLDACTRCQEKYDSKWRLIVGSFSASGLHVNPYGDDDSVGVGGLRKFY